MNTLIDIKISDLQKSTESATQITKQLYEQVKDTEDIDLIHSYSSFLYASGLHKTLLKFIIRCFKKSKPIPWWHLFLLSSKFDLDAVSLDWVYDLFSSHHSEQDWKYGLTSSCLNNMKLLLQKQSYLNQFYENHSCPQLDLEKKIRSAGEQNRKQEEGLIKELIKLDPKNPFFKDYLLEYNTKKAIRFLEIYKSDKKPSSELSNHSKELDLDPRYSKRLLTTLQKKIKTDPHLIEDIVVALGSMSLYGLAASLLEKQLDNFSRQNLYLDCLIESKQYLKCLNYADELYINISSDTQIAFELSLAKARAYYGLKEYKKAKSIVTNLISIKPKSQTLLTMLSQLQSIGEQ